MTLVGCGKSNPAERLPLYGSISATSGENINGSITFLPDGGRTGPAATTSIVGGKYQFDRDNGPTAGANRVVVNRALPKGSLTFEMVREKFTKANEAAEKAAKAKTPKDKAAIEKAAAEEKARFEKQFRTSGLFPQKYPPRNPIPTISRSSHNRIGHRQC